MSVKRVCRCVGVVGDWRKAPAGVFPQCRCRRRLVRVSRGQRRPRHGKRQRQKSSSNAHPRSERNGQNSRKPASSLTGRAARWAAGLALASVAGVGTLLDGGGAPAVLWEMGPSRGMNHWSRGVGFEKNDRGPNFASDSAKCCSFDRNLGLAGV